MFPGPETKPNSPAGYKWSRKDRRKWIPAGLVSIYLVRGAPAGAKVRADFIVVRSLTEPASRNARTLLANGSIWFAPASRR